MKNLLGWMSASLVAVCAGMTACSDSGKQSDEQSVETGTLALPLTSVSPTGTQYRLRNAVFIIEQPYCYDYGVGGNYTAAGSGGNGCMSPVILDSETDPSAASLAVELEQGSYRVTLQNGWTMQRIDGGEATPVEAQLLSGDTQWAYVSPRYTNWVSYQFGIGDRSIWFNGKLNIDIQVYDNPDQYYGPSYGGYAGMTSLPPSMGGAVTTAGGATYY